MAAQLYLLFVFVIATIPASLAVSLKATLLVLVALSSTVLMLPRMRECLAERYVVGVLATYVAVILGLSLLTLQRESVEPGGVASAAVRYLAVPLAVYLGWLYVRFGRLDTAALLRVIFGGHLLYMSMKILSMIALGACGYCAADMLLLASTLVPDATIHGFTGNAYFVRIFLGNDAITPFLFMAYLYCHYQGLIHWRVLNWLYHILSVAVVAVSFTRYMWLSMALICLFWTVLLLRRLSWRAVRNNVLAIVAGLFLAGTLVTGLFATGEDCCDSDACLAGAGLRERMEDNASHAEKLAQVQKMWQVVEGDLFIGAGVGAHIAGHLRPDKLDFQYEVQWMALFMQTGLLGIMTIALLTTMPLWPLLRGGRQVYTRPESVFLAAGYGLWLGGALTNPYLFILTSVLVYLSVLACAWHLQTVHASVEPGSVVAAA